MVRKAIIPIAGLGRRMAPLSSAVPKALLPLVDSRMRVLPVVHYILAEAAAAGIEQAALICSPGHVDMLRRYFTAARKDPNVRLGVDVEYIIQPSPVGLGEAVVRGASFVRDEPFMLLLGDHVYAAEAGQPPCAAQVAQAYREHAPATMIGMQVVGADMVHRVGVAKGQNLGGRLYKCMDLVEKPTPEVARQRLVSDGLGADRFLAHSGVYIFTGEIFTILTRMAAADRPAGEEVQLTDAQAQLLRAHPNEYLLYHVAGKSLDTGNPQAYLQAFDAIRRAGG